MNQPLWETPITSLSRKNVLTALAVSLVLTAVAFYLFPLSPQTMVKPYVNMAKNPFRYEVEPFGFRLLTPLMVHYLSNNIDSGFRAVAFVAYLFSGLLLYMILRGVGAVALVSLALLAGFYFAPASRMLIANTWYIDPMSFLFMLVAFIGVFSRNYGLTTAALTAGAFNRPESIPLAVIALVGWWQKDRPLSSLLPAILCTVPALLLIAAIRWIWPQLSEYGLLSGDSGRTLQYGWIDLKNIFSRQGFSVFISSTLYRELMPYLWTPAFLGVLLAPLRLRILTLTYILVAVLPMVAANDFFRLPFYAFPSIFILAAIGLNRLGALYPAMAYGALAYCGILLAVAPQSIWLGLAGGVALMFFYYTVKPKNQASSSA